MLDKIIHSDQTGFIGGRQLYSNLCWVYDVMYLPGSIDVPEAIITLDAHKPFGRMEHGYLLSALKHFGFGPSFCSWVNLLYTCPQAVVRTKNNMSKYFSLFRGTR